MPEYFISHLILHFAHLWFDVVVNIVFLGAKRQKRDFGQVLHRPQALGLHYGELHLCDAHARRENAPPAASLGIVLDKREKRLLEPVRFQPCFLLHQIIASVATSLREIASRPDSWRRLSGQSTRIGPPISSNPSATSSSTGSSTYAATRKSATNEWPSEAGLKNKASRWITSASFTKSTKSGFTIVNFSKIEPQTSVLILHSSNEDIMQDIPILEIDCNEEFHDDEEIKSKMLQQVK